MTWQDALWAFVNGCGRWWDVVFAVIAVIASVGLFVIVILRQRFSMLLLSRSLVALGLLLSGMIPLNSGWTKISLALLILGCSLSTFLLSTRWHKREHPGLEVRQEFGDWLYRTVAATLPTLHLRRRTEPK